MTDSQIELAQLEAQRRSTRGTWLLVVCTVPAGLVVFWSLMVGFMSSVSCNDETCDGPGDFWELAIGYAAFWIPVVTASVSIVTAQMAKGIWVPIVGLALLTSGFAAILVTY